MSHDISFADPRVRAGVTSLALIALVIAAPTGGTAAPASSQSRRFVPTTDSFGSSGVAMTRTAPPPSIGISKLASSATTPLPRPHRTRVESAHIASTGAPRRYDVPVLMYHRIAPASERGGDLTDLVLDPRVFDAQLAALQAQGWHTMTSAELARAVIANDAVPARSFVITLDDGREDGYTHAFPLLVKHGFVATFFVITARVNQGRYLTWTQLGEMQAAGMEIGNHTVSHVDEARSTRARTDRQVLGAQDAIRRNLGTPPVSFAYPFGRMPATLVASVMASGLAVAYTTVRGADETAATAYFWPRLRVNATTTAASVLRLVKPYASQPSPRSGRPAVDRSDVPSPSAAGSGQAARGGAAW